MNDNNGTNCNISFFEGNTFFFRESNVTARKKSDQEYMLALLRTLGNSVRPLCVRVERPQWALAASPSSCLSFSTLRL